jgi:photosystem II S4 domain protein
MSLPRASLLEGSRQPHELEALIQLAEQVLRTWQPLWSPFVTAAVREEAAERLGCLSELSLGADGGWPQAERCRLLLSRSDAGIAAEADPGSTPIAGLELSGNFLFDAASPADFRDALANAGADPGELGDLWVRGDRGAQLLATPGLAARLLEAQATGAPLLVRTVEVRIEGLTPDRLQFPSRPLPRRLSSVEASCRLDAVASAGFGLSRNRMGELIRSGAVRVNWTAVTSPSRELVAGERIQLEGRGELTIETVEATKRQRWWLQMTRR